MTQEEYKEVMKIITVVKEQNSRWKGFHGDDAMTFYESFNEKKESVPNGWKFTLPTEAQWEYAWCRNDN